MVIWNTEHSTGWQRFTLVEFQQRSRDRSLIIDEGGVIPCLSQALREDAVCTAAFEGVVFPGGNIIAGRQWDPFSGEYLIVGMRRKWLIRT